MKSFALRSLRSQLLVAFGVLALVPLAALGYLSAREGMQQLETRAGERLSVHASNAAKGVSEYLAERTGDAAVFIRHPAALAGTSQELATLTDEYIAAYDTYDLIVIADRDGKIVGINSRTGDHKPVPADMVGRSVKGQPWFDAIANAPAGTLYGSPTVEVDPLTQQATHGDAKGYTFALGIYDDKGQLARVWSNHLSWDRSVAKVAEGELEAMKRNGITTGQVHIIDKTGKLIAAAPAEIADVNANVVASGSQLAKLALGGQRGYGSEFDTVGHNDDVIGYAPVSDYDDFKANGWAVLTHERQSEVAGKAAGLRNFALLVGLCSAVFVAFGAVWFARRLTRRIGTVVATLERVAAGDLTARATVSGDDEIAAMTKALHTALDRLGGAFASIGHSVGELSRASESLTVVGTTLSSSADDTSRQAGVVAAASEQAGKNVQTVATGTEEMSVTIKEIAKNAAEAAKVATAAVGRAQRTNELVGKLGESSIEIGNVLKVITSIAEQTNLLALNATIEAARAGEAGKGFAVVANEVKELAKETARATEDITRKIEAIQTDTTSAVGAIGEITNVIGQINDIQSTIASAVEQQAATTNEIGRNLHELAQASGEIAQNVTSVAASAGSTSECSMQTRSAATSLQDLSRSLDDQMRQFTYDHDAAAVPTTPSASAPRRRTVTGTLVRVPPAISFNSTPSSNGFRH